MKNTLLFAFLLSLPATAAFAKPKAPSASFVEAKDVKWSAVPGFEGVHMATVEGNAEKGSHHTFMKFDAGFAAPLHHHTSDHFVTVVSGTLTLNVDGKEHKLPAGSFFSFKNKGAHTTACGSDSDCVLLVDGRGKWDVVPEKK